MKEIIAYLKNPTYVKKQQFDYRVFLKTLGVQMLFLLLIVPFLFIWSSIFDVEKAVDLGGWKLLIAGVFIAPIFEELVFRLGLRPSAGHFMFYIVFFVFFILMSLIEQNLIVISILLLLLLVFSVLQYRLVNHTIQFYRCYLRNFKYIFYFSCLLFGLVHIFNFKYDGYTSILVLSLMVLPQIFGGGLLGFIRMKYGLRYSMLLHACYNGIFIIPSILFDL